MHTHFAYFDRYEMMCKCWKISPSERPTFAELRSHFEGLLEGQHASEYIAFSAPMTGQDRGQEGEMPNEMAESMYLPHILVYTYTYSKVSYVFHLIMVEGEPECYQFPHIYISTECRNGSWPLK